MDLRLLNFGIEIETINRARDQVARAIQSAVGGVVTDVPRGGRNSSWQVTDDAGRRWRIVADRSLENVPAHLRAEIVSPILTYADIPTLQGVVRAVRESGATVDERCAVHVHVDASAFDGRTLANLAKIVYKQEELILTALGVSSDRQSRYTRPMGQELIAQIERYHPQSRDELNRIWYGYQNQNPEHYDRTRYHGVNLHSVWYRGTIEFRWFEGTLHAGKIKAYIQLVLAVAAKALRGRSASSRRRHLDQQSARYDFRVFLLRLGLIGDEFKTARKHLLAALPGDAAFKRGRPKPGARETSSTDAPAALSTPTSVPMAVWQGIQAVRESGITNMLDRPQVAGLAASFGHPDAAQWIADHPAEYAAGVFHGFVVDTHQGSS